MTDTTTQNVAQGALREHLRLLAARQIEDWVELFAPDGVIEFPFAPPGVPGRVQGRDALVAHMTGFAEGVEIEFVDLVFHETVDPRVAVAEFGTTGRATATGRPYEQRCVAVVHTDSDGRIVLFKDYWNPLVAIRAFAADGDPAAG